MGKKIAQHFNRSAGEGVVSEDEFVFFVDVLKEIQDNFLKSILIYLLLFNYIFFVIRIVPFWIFHQLSGICRHLSAQRTHFPKTVWNVGEFFVYWSLTEHIRVWKSWERPSTVLKVHVEFLTCSAFFLQVLFEPSCVHFSVHSISFWSHCQEITSRLGKDFVQLTLISITLQNDWFVELIRLQETFIFLHIKIL